MSGSFSYFSCLEVLCVEQSERRGGNKARPKKFHYMKFRIHSVVLSSSARQVRIRVGRVNRTSVRRGSCIRSQTLASSRLQSSYCTLRLAPLQYDPWPERRAKNKARPEAQRGALSGFTVFLYGSNPCLCSRASPFQGQESSKASDGVETRPDPKHSAVR